MNLPWIKSAPRGAQHDLNEFLPDCTGARPTLAYRAAVTSCPKAPSTQKHCAQLGW